MVKRRGQRDKFALIHQIDVCLAKIPDSQDAAQHLR